jgi:hypothetical protein
MLRIMARRMKGPRFEYSAEIARETADMADPGRGALDDPALGEPPRNGKHLCV